MSVYLKDSTHVLLNSGLVATSSACCCGGGGDQCCTFTFNAINTSFCFTLENGDICAGGVDLSFSADSSTNPNCCLINATGTGDSGQGSYTWYVFTIDNGDGTFDLHYGVSWTPAFAVCNADVGTINADFIHTGLSCDADQSLSDNNSFCSGSGNCTCPSGGTCNQELGFAATATYNHTCGQCCIAGVCSNRTSGQCADAGGTFHDVGRFCDGVDAIGACCAFGTCLDDVDCSVCVGTFGGTCAGPCTICADNPCP